MATLRELKIISRITYNFVNKNSEAVNLFDYLVSYISSKKTDFLQRKVLIDLLHSNIHNQKTFLFNIAYHYYLTTNGGENPIELLTRENIIDDYYREVNAMIISVKNNSKSQKKKEKWNN